MKKNQTTLFIIISLMNMTHLKKITPLILAQKFDLEKIENLRIDINS